MAHEPIVLGVIQKNKTKQKNRLYPKELPNPRSGLSSFEGMLAASREPGLGERRQNGPKKYCRAWMQTFSTSSPNPTVLGHGIINPSIHDLLTPAPAWGGGVEQVAS